MDHSVTEQLLGNAEEWHTTAIALSESGEISDFSKEIAQCISTKNDYLKKWSGRNKQKYRSLFRKYFFELLPKFEIYVYINSAQEKSITQNKKHVISELSLTHLYNNNTKSSKKISARIGPFIRTSDETDHFFVFSDNRAQMILWIAHFMCRAHADFFNYLKSSFTDTIGLDWFLYADKLPGAGEELDFLILLVNRFTPNGNIRISNFDQGDTVNTDLLADNIAGMFNEIAKHREMTPLEKKIVGGGKIHMETFGMNSV